MDMHMHTCSELCAAATEDDDDEVPLPLLEQHRPPRQSGEVGEVGDRG